MVITFVNRICICLFILVSFHICSDSFVFRFVGRKRDLNCTRTDAYNGIESFCYIVIYDIVKSQ